MQIEYTLMAVGLNHTSIGIKAANGVVITTANKLPSVLMDEESPEAGTSMLQVIDWNRRAHSDERRRSFAETRGQQKRSGRPVEVNAYSWYPTVDAPQERRPLSFLSRQSPATWGKEGRKNGE